MNIGIFGRSTSKEFITALKKIISVIQGYNHKIYIYQPFLKQLQKQDSKFSKNKSFSLRDDLNKKIDFLISIGGDGTLLNTLRIVKNSNVPILGINTGRLGFLSSINVEQLEETIQCLEKKAFYLDKRTLLELKSNKPLYKTDENIALNEFTIHKIDSASMITIHVYLNDEFLNTYWADGLIVSTPTGSTAYSLSCGGPIVLPGSGNLILTPIAPHNLNVRPLVIPDNGVIKLKLESRSKHYLIALDSRSVTINNEVEITLQKSTKYIEIVRLNSQSFLKTLRNKLMWGVDKRN
ncbi:MAG: NAD kinase [Vicingaceae bacterium]